MVDLKITINEQEYSFKEEMSLYQVAARIKGDADILILNGHIVDRDFDLNENDKISLIRRGEVPKFEELEHLMISRHTPNIHKKVKEGKVAIAGLGGLGSNVAISLARTGVGKLLLVDFDVVEPSNLNRQQYYIRHIGMKKTTALKEIIEQINPFIEVITVDKKIETENIEEIFSDYQVIVEALDRATEKSKIVNGILEKLPKAKVIAGSGIGGFESSNSIKTRKAFSRLYICGDETTEAIPGRGLMAPRVLVGAGHQANLALRLILGEDEI